MTIEGNDGRGGRRLTGVMILHGFTANLESVRPLFESVRQTGLELVTPLLRGHGQASPDALRGVTWHDWLDDAAHALIAAAGTGGTLVVLGHSMGSLLALQLAARYPELVDSVILATPPLRIVSPLAPGRPLHFLAPLVGRVVDRWDMQACFADPEVAIMPEQYRWAPTRAILSMFDLLEATIPVMSEVRAPALILHGRHESIVLPESAGLVMQALGTPAADKRVAWFEKTDHQIFCDCERLAAVNEVTGFIARRIEAGRPIPVPGLAKSR
ncbi:MAG: alpha/beta fold hydrolase [Chlorobiaceae bacterium]|nr:alpha/beta fold hydrolase [Chlorobiaceae bacterium]